VKDYNQKLPKVKACIFGSSGQWTPEMEKPPKKGEHCKNCGAINGPNGMSGGKIQPGSRLYCPACHMTGWEKQIKAMLEAEKKAAEESEE